MLLEEKRQKGPGFNAKIAIIVTINAAYFKGRVVNNLIIAREQLCGSKERIDSRCGLS